MNNNSSYTKESFEIGDLSLTVFLLKEKPKRQILEIPTIFHSHFYTEIFICKKGEFTLTTELGSAKLFPADVAIMPQNHSHYLSCDGDADSEFFSFGIIGTKIEDRCKGGAYEELRELFCAKSARIYRKRVREAETLSDAIFGEIGAALRFIKLAGALLEINECKAFEALDARHSARNDTREADGIDFMLIEDIINTYYTEQINYGELAARLHISRRHLDRIVRAKYGKTLREMIYQSRIDLAKKLLLEGDDGIDLIAVKTGFKSTAAFRASFIQIAGLTPSEYRRR